MTDDRVAYRHARAHGLEDEDAPPVAARESEAWGAASAAEDLDEDCFAAPENCVDPEEEDDDGEA